MDLKKDEDGRGWIVPIHPNTTNFIIKFMPKCSQQNTNAKLRLTYHEAVYLEKDIEIHSPYPVIDFPLVSERDTWKDRNGVTSYRIRKDTDMRILFEKASRIKFNCSLTIAPFKSDKHGHEGFDLAKTSEVFYESDEYLNDELSEFEYYEETPGNFTELYTSCVFDKMMKFQIPAGTKEIIVPAKVNRRNSGVYRTSTVSISTPCGSSTIMVYLQ